MEEHMIQDIFSTFGRFELGKLQHHGPLLIFPLLAKTPPLHKYISLRQALDHGELSISELSQAGSVPDLKVVNKGKHQVLILAGEELRGAKQNRVLNTTVLIAPDSELVVPVSCTEAGRWAYQDSHFSESGNMMAPSIKAKMTRSVNTSFMRGRSARSDQTEVWDEIDKLQQNMQMPSPTAAMADVYNGSRHRLEDSLVRFPLLEGQCGIYVMLKGRFVGLDLVSSPEVWRHLHAKIVKSYGMDALRFREPGYPADIHPPDLGELLSDLNFSVFPGIGLGEELRVEKPGITGSALVIDDEIIHLSLFPLEEEQMPIVESFHRPMRARG